MVEYNVLNAEIATFLLGQARMIVIVGQNECQTKPVDGNRMLEVIENHIG